MVDCERFSSAENAQQQRKTAKPDGIRGTVKCSPIVIVSTSMRRVFGIVWPAVRAMQCIPATNPTNPISIALELNDFQTLPIDPAHKIQPGGIHYNKNLTQITTIARMPSCSL